MSFVLPRRLSCPAETHFDFFLLAAEACEALNHSYLWISRQRRRGGYNFENPQGLNHRQIPTSATALKLLLMDDASWAFRLRSKQAGLLATLNGKSTNNVWATHPPEHRLGCRAF